MKAKVIIGCIIGALLLILLVQNTEVVSLRFLFWELSMSRIILLPLVMLSGVVIGFVLGKKNWN